MSIKQSESRSGLKSKLASRNLEFEDSELEEALKKYNYFNLFNVYWVTHYFAEGRVIYTKLLTLPVGTTRIAVA